VDYTNHCQGISPLPQFYEIVVASQLVWRVNSDIQYITDLPIILFSTAIICYLAISNNPTLNNPLISFHWQWPLAKGIIKLNYALDPAGHRTWVILSILWSQKL
jgi:hypothetical protein